MRRAGDVAADATTLAHGQSIAELGLGEVVGRPLGLGGEPDGARRPAHERRVRGDVIVLVEEGAKADLHVVQRRQGADEVEAALAQGPPEALHFSASGRVAGTRVEKRAAEPLAAETEDLATISRAIVEVEGVGRPVAAEGGDEEAEHVDLFLGVVGVERDDEPGSVVEETVNAERARLAVDEESRSVADVAVPQSAGPLGLPAQTGFASGTVA